MPHYGNERWNKRCFQVKKYLILEVRMVITILMIRGRNRNNSSVEKWGRIRNGLENLYSRWIERFKLKFEAYGILHNIKMCFMTIWALLGGANWMFQQDNIFTMNQNSQETCLKKKSLIFCHSQVEGQIWT